MLLDFDLNQSIQSDLSVSPTLSFKQLPPLQGTGQLEEIEDVTGEVTAKDAANNQFTLQTATGQSLTFKVDAQTEFDEFDEIGCAASDFTCVAMGLLLEVEARLMADGTLVAEEVEPVDLADEEDLEGILISVDSPSQFTMVVTEETVDIAGVDVGNLVTATIQTGARFEIGGDDLPLPPDISFASSSDLLVGQNLEVRRLSTSSGTSITTDRVTLEESQFTARVKSVGTNSFTVDNLPSLFATATPAVTEIEVLTSPQTEFEDVSGVTGLGVGNTVSLEGLLFKTTGIPKLVAEDVRKR